MPAGRAAGSSPCRVVVRERARTTVAHCRTGSGSAATAAIHPEGGRGEYPLHGSRPETPASMLVRFAGRMHVAIVDRATVNGEIIAASGGQLSTVGSPLPPTTHVVHLNAGDRVSVGAWTETNTTFGGAGNR